LIDKKITSPKHLGIEGGSNGGLLMGVMFTQRPDLFNAVVCAVPLLDMMRFHTLLAGASWMGEYGNPEDRKVAKRMEDQGHDFLYYENIDGGHSAAANLKETAKRLALQHTYLMQKLKDGK